MLFNDRVYERIKETRQADKLNDFYCELESDGLYMGYVYEAASLILPRHYTIIDLGCYMAAQAFLFEDFKRYNGIDCYDMFTFVDYIPPRRFKTTNAFHFCMSIQEACEDVFPNIDNHYAIMNAVPEDGSLRELVLSKFENVAVVYPGEEGIFKGVYAKEMRQITNTIKNSNCPFTYSYLRENPEIAREYGEKQLRAEKMIKDLMSVLN